MIRPIALLLFVAAAQLWSSASSAQSPNRVTVVGVLTVTAGPSDPVATSFRDGLRQFGYIDGQNIKIDHRNADGRVDQLPRLAEELVRLPADIIAVGAEPALSIDLFWYKGKLYSDQISAPKPDPDPPPPDLNIQVISIPKYVWWVKIRNARGQTGWSRETEKFDNMDACG